MKKQDVINKILETTNHDTLKEYSDAINLRWKELESRIIVGFTVGDAVTYKDHGRTVHGTIVKINPKTIVVKNDDSNMHWRMSPSLLTKC